jgi:hypothetical protein
VETVLQVAGLSLVLDGVWDVSDVAGQTVILWSDIPFPHSLPVCARCWTLTGPV